MSQEPSRGMEGAARPPRARGPLARLRTPLACLALVIVAQEVLLRALVPLPELKNFNRANYMPQSLSGGATAVRSAHTISESTPDKVSVEMELNAYGFRDREWRLEKRPGTPRIMFIGDSFVEGAKVEELDSIPRVFQARAGASGLRMEAMNFGVSGANAQDYARLIADAAPWFKPDGVVLVFFANDFHENAARPARSAPEPWPAYLPRGLEILRMIRNGEMLPRRGAFPHPRVNQPVPHPNNPLSNPEYADQMARFVAPWLVKTMREGGFNPFRPGSTWWYEEELREPIDVREDLAIVGRSLAAVRSRLLVAYLPERRQVSNYYKRFEREYSPDDYDMTQPSYQLHQRQIAAQCAALGLPFLDLTPAIAAAESAGVHLYWDYDDHLRAAGNHLVAHALYDAWTRPAQP